LVLDNGLPTLRFDPVAAAGRRFARGRTGKITKICFYREEPIPFPRHYQTEERRLITFERSAKHEQEREEIMAIYITQGRYTSDAVKGMVANPENREKAVAELMEKAGGKLLAHYFTFGEYDFLSVSEAPSEEVMASALIAGAASGGISHLRTSLALTAKDAMKAFKSAGALSKGFKPPGR
jgi:uncharacterized protein with GYD domain